MSDAASAMSGTASAMSDAALAMSDAASAMSDAVLAMSDGSQPSAMPLYSHARQGSGAPAEGLCLLRVFYDSSSRRMALSAEPPESADRADVATSAVGGDAAKQLDDECDEQPSMVVVRADETSNVLRRQLQEARLELQSRGLQVTACQSMRRTHRHRGMHACVHAYARMRARTHAHKHTRTHARTRTHAHAHTDRTAGG